MLIIGSPVIRFFTSFARASTSARIQIGVVKQIETGGTTPANLRVGVEHTLEMRTRIIPTPPTSIGPTCSSSTKEPLGLRGEVVPALKLLKGASPLVLGLRDVMDDPAALARNGSARTSCQRCRDLRLHDEIWITACRRSTNHDRHPGAALGTAQDGLYRLPAARFCRHADIPHEIGESVGRSSW